MGAHFDARKDSPLLRSASMAFVNALLDELLPHLTLAARGCGYAIAVHGSRSRDIDMIAVPWAADADEPRLLVERLLGALAGSVGRAVATSQLDPLTWEEKPHGRRALTIILPGMCPEIDLSIMPRAASAIETVGEDPQGLRAEHESATRQGDAQ